MILRRLGNKSKIASEIHKHFPKHTIYLETFFGAGGMYFNKPKAKYNFLNDLDSDVFNLFQVISQRKDDFVSLFELMPIHNDLFDYWMNNQEEDEIRRAVRFVMLSNFSLYGKMDTLRLGCVSPKEQVFKNIDKTFEYIKGGQFTNCDFRKMFKSISIDPNDKKNAFIYNDPPYLGTTDNYSSSFTEEDSFDLFNCLENTGIKWAMSEFNHPFIINQAQSRGLNIIEIGERQNLKNRRIEILVTNYQVNQLQLFTA
ncbi:DNA adenine methylase [Sphingobacterium siyangense]|uniref:site-specific DNA-methyltransferase (adenine-specific) n=1 Tax=Sphingobacterium multivorum TaxID=28454 RepID=A0A654D4I4_SPHMU|nr:DNA adenine methylase [Sphingobacterium multivorum]VXC99441.1 DNA adenine methylase [Sphingobacterium multivorum]